MQNKVNDHITKQISVQYYCMCNQHITDWLHLVKHIPHET